MRTERFQARAHDAAHLWGRRSVAKEVGEAGLILRSERGATQPYSRRRRGGSPSLLLGLPSPPGKDSALSRNRFGCVRARAHAAKRWASIVKAP